MVNVGVIAGVTILLWIVFGQLNILPNRCFNPDGSKREMNGGDKFVFAVTLMSAVAGTVYCMYTVANTAKTMTPQGAAMSMVGGGKGLMSKLGGLGGFGHNYY